MLVKVPSGAKCREYAVASPEFQAATSSWMIFRIATSSAVVVAEVNRTAPTVTETVNQAASRVSLIALLGEIERDRLELPNGKAPNCARRLSRNLSKEEQSPCPSSPIHHAEHIHRGRSRGF